MKKSELNRVLLFTLGILFSLQLVLAAVGAEKVHLVWFTRPHGGYLEAHTAIAKLFMEKHPDIEVEIISGFDDVLLPRLAGGATTDIYMANVAPSWASKGQLLDLSALSKADTTRPLAQIPSSLIQATSFKGSLVALPAYWFVSAVAYNPQLLQESGVPFPQDKWTWEDYRKSAKRVTRDTNGDSVPDIWGAVSSSNALHIFPWWLWQAGAEVFDPDTYKVGTSSPAAMTAWNFLYDLQYNDRVNPDISAENLEPLFRQNKAGFVNAVTSDTRPNEAFGTEYEVVSQPTGPSGKKATYLVVAFMGIHPSTKHPQEAWELLKFIISEEGQRYAHEATANLPFAATLPTNIKVANQIINKGTQGPHNKYVWTDALAYARDADALPPGVNTVSAANTLLNNWRKLASGASLAQVVNNITSELNAMLPQK